MSDEPLDKFSLSTSTNRRLGVVIQIATLVLLWVAWGIIVSLNPKQWQEVTALFLIVGAMAALNMCAESRDDGLNPELRQRADGISKRREA